MSTHKVVLVGGGTGGHFYPLIAVAEQLQNTPELALYYFGPKPYNKESLEKNNITFISCPAGKRRKYFSLLNFFDFFKILGGIGVALWKLYIIYPDVIFSKGGYTSVPITIAGWLLKIPIIIHESDTKPGSANKLAAKFARYIAISFADVAQFFPKEKIVLTGIPLRKSFTTNINNPQSQLGIPSDLPLIFITGGSQGAQRINDLILNSLDELLPNFTILHQTGGEHVSNVQSTAASLLEDSSLLERYFVRGSLTGTEMSLAQSAASIIVSRAGTGTIFEIAKKGKPSILIPIPEEISHDQRSNAYAYARSGAATVLEEHNLTDDLLTAEIMRIMNNKEEYTQMSTAASAFAANDAAVQIAQAIIDINHEHD